MLQPNNKLISILRVSYDRTMHAVYLQDRSGVSKLDCVCLLCFCTKLTWGKPATTALRHSLAFSFLLMAFRKTVLLKQTGEAVGTRRVARIVLARNSYPVLSFVPFPRRCPGRKLSALSVLWTRVVAPFSQAFFLKSWTFGRCQRS